MTCFQPFKALRPYPEFAQQVLCPPYDVISTEEARRLAAEHPRSFLHVIRSEVDLPGADPYSDEVYRKAAENLAALEHEGIYFTEKESIYYIYSQTQNGRTQTGIVGCASIDDYENGTIKKHEITRTEKELDRIRHFDTCSADTEPVFFFFRNDAGISGIMQDITRSGMPAYDVTDCEGVRHRLWPVYDRNICEKLRVLFDRLPGMYIADGHHRTASAARVGEKRRAAAPDYDGSEEFNRFMAVAFPADQLKVFGYHRLVRDLNGLSEDTFLQKISEICSVQKITGADPVPAAGHTCSMYLGKTWYRLSFEGSILHPDDPVASLDVALLQDLILAPLLGIEDPRTDPRIRFAGGTKGTDFLKNCVNSGEMATAFAMYPVSLEEIMKVADAGLVMPPKSTWFEPKLGSGLFVHRF